MEKSAAEFKQGYLQKKNQVLALLKETQDFYQQDDNKKRAQVFAELGEKLRKGSFSIVIVGEFSTGKSTLLNALMGRKLLPAFTNEATATVNFLRYKEEAPHGEAGIVYYNNGKKVELSESNVKTIEQYVSTRGDTEQSKIAQLVDHVDLYLDSDFLKDGVTLIDSPGLNGIAEGHREITEDQIEKSHASIFLFSSDHPGSKTDFDMLNELLQRVDTVFFVLNKIDVIKEAEGESVEDVIEKLKENYHTKFPKAKIPEILPVAAYNALQARDPELNKDLTATQRENLEASSRLSAFESRLMRFLTCGGKTKQELMAPVARIIGLVKENRDNYEEEKGALADMKDGDALNDKLEALKEEKADLDKKQRTSVGHVKVLLNQGFQEVRNELSASVDNFTKEKLAEIKGIETLDELNEYLQDFEKQYLYRVQRYLRDADDKLKDSIKDVVYQEFAKEAEAIEVKLNEIGTAKLKITLKNHLNMSGTEVDTDWMDEKEEKLREQLHDTQDELSSLVASDAEYDFLMQEKASLQARLEGISASEMAMQQYELPSVQQHLIHVEKKRARTGILGRLANGIIGDKRIIEEQWVDDEGSKQARQAAIDYRDNQLAQFQSQREEASDQLSQISRDIKSIQASRAAYQQKTQQINNLRQEMIDLQKKNQEILAKEMRSAVQKTRKVLRDYCYQIQDDVDEQTKELLRQASEAYTTNIVEFIDSELQDVLAEKTKQIENVQKQMNDSLEGKKKRIADLDQKIESLNSLLVKASDLQIEIDQIKTDKIQKEA